jgi:hypothetical protein
MEAATLNGMSGLGELHVVRSPEQLQINGLWILLDSVHLGDLFTLHESGEVVVYDGLVTVDRDEPTEHRQVQVTIRSLDTNVDEETGEVQVTAGLRGVTGEELVR